VELLGGYGSPVIFKIAVPGAVAVHAANPCLPELPIGLPNLVRELLDAWAFWLANPTFSTQTLEVDCGLKFSADVPPEWIIDCEQVADPNQHLDSRRVTELPRLQLACAPVKGADNATTSTALSLRASGEKRRR
jgi:hypothetical protein